MWKAASDMAPMTLPHLLVTSGQQPEGTEALGTIVSEEFNSATNHWMSLEVDLLQLNFEMTVVPGNALTAASWETLK